MKPSADLVKKMLSYNPETGVFVWLVTRGGYAKAGSIAGRINASGYSEIAVNRVRYGAHRLAWLIMTGEWPSKSIDHINCDRSDNRFANLRLATLEENAHNSLTPANNVSGFKGVSWKSKNRKWVAQIAVGNRKFHIGLFDTPEDAHAAYVNAAARYHGEFARAS